MTKNAIVMSRSCAGEECVSHNVFIPTIHIGGRAAGTVVLVEGIARCIPHELCSGLGYYINALNRKPAEVGMKGLKVRSSFGNGALIDATFQESRHIFAD